MYHFNLRSTYESTEGQGIRMQIPKWLLYPLVYLAGASLIYLTTTGILKSQIKGMESRIKTELKDMESRLTARLDELEQRIGSLEKMVGDTEQGFEGAEINLQEIEHPHQMEFEITYPQK